MRCFLAIDLPIEIQEELIKIQEKFRKYITGKFVEKENLHLTLKFFGELNNQQITSLIENLHRVKFNIFKSHLGKLGVFTSSFPRILWVSLEPEERIRKIYNIISKNINFSEENKSFTSHITLARIKNIKDKQEFFKKLNLNIGSSEFLINDFVLKESILTDKRPIYKDIFNFKLLDF